MKRNRKSFRTALILLTILAVTLASSLCVSAGSSYRVEKYKYITVCYPNGTPYIKIENTVLSALDVRMRNRSGKVVWQENKAIRRGETYRTFYCGKNVYRIDIRVNSSNPKFYGSIVWKTGSKRQLK